MRSAEALLPPSNSSQRDLRDGNDIASPSQIWIEIVAMLLSFCDLHSNGACKCQGCVSAIGNLTFKDFQSLLHRCWRASFQDCSRRRSKQQHILGRRRHIWKVRDYFSKYAEFVLMCLRHYASPSLLDVDACICDADTVS